MKILETYQFPAILTFNSLLINPFHKDGDMIKMEERIMEELDSWSIVDTPIKYLELYTRLNNLSDKNFYIAQYILEFSYWIPRMMEVPLQVY